MPVSIRPAMLALMHEGHLGIEKSTARARQTLWWPGMSRMIETTVGSCTTCCASRRQQPEPLMPHPVPSFPWEKIGADIFTYDKRDYLLVVDYFSKFPFIIVLPDKSASSVINMLKSLYAMYDTPLTTYRSRHSSCVSSPAIGFSKSYVQPAVSAFKWTIGTLHSDREAATRNSGGESDRPSRRATELWS